MIRTGELIQLISPKGKRYTMVLDPAEELHTHEGRISLEQIQNLEFGQAVPTHLGKEYRVLKPTLYDLLKNVERKTQIIYPKDIGYILIKLGIGPGWQVMEVGSGSGSLTMALAWYVGDSGQVHSFEQRSEFIDLCARNLSRVGLRDRVTFYEQDIAAGSELTDIPAAFIDVRTPWDYLEQLTTALRNGGPAGFLLPTTNQVEHLIQAMKNHPFAEIEVLEILVRHYKPVPDRLRPDDRMVAHTGYMLFCRVIK